jgi:hypothetical protein
LQPNRKPSLSSLSRTIPAYSLLVTEELFDGILSRSGELKKGGTHSVPRHGASCYYRFGGGVVVPFGLGVVEPESDPLFLFFLLSFFESDDPFPLLSGVDVWAPPGLLVLGVVVEGD